MRVAPVELIRFYERITDQKPLGEVARRKWKLPPGELQPRNAEEDRAAESERERVARPCRAARPVTAARARSREIAISWKSMGSTGPASWRREIRRPEESRAVDQSLHDGMRNLFAKASVGSLLFYTSLFVARRYIYLYAPRVRGGQLFSSRVIYAKWME